MAREYRGGYYQMDHISFGKMMISEQLRPPLSAVSGLIVGSAKANAMASSAGGEGKRKSGARKLAESYEAVRGPIVVILSDGFPGPRITGRVINRARHAARNEFGAGGWQAGRGTRNLRRAGEAHGNLQGEAG